MRFRFLAVYVFICVFTTSLFGQTVNSEPRVRNVILMIGDGMGFSHITAASLAKDSALHMFRADVAGVMGTSSANNRVTDSAAASTALATGHKANNRSIGVDAQMKPVVSILERASQAGFATGIVVTSHVLHATPAAFYSHTESRSDYNDIVEHLYNADIDIIIGGGHSAFSQKEHNKDYITRFSDKGYNVSGTLDQVLESTASKQLALLSINGHLPYMSEGRGDVLPKATRYALEKLATQADKRGMFVMIEGSKIDYAGHAKSATKIIDEVFDFDKAVEEAFAFADKTPGTLVIVLADHETGGLTIPSKKKNYELADSGVKFKFSTFSHTATFVPVFAHGEGAEKFSRLLDNTDVPKIIASLMGLKL